MGVGTLVLKIPWKKIYTAPVEVVIEDLFAIAGPNAGSTAYFTDAYMYCPTRVKTPSICVLIRCYLELES